MPRQTIAIRPDRNDRNSLRIGQPAHPRRGLKDHVYAVDFAREFALGATVSTAQFDDWCERHGLLAVPRDVSKNSVQWKAHLQDRHACKMRLNRGASHPRMQTEGLSAFSLVSVGQGSFEVKSAHTAIIEGELPKKLQSLVETKHRHLKYLVESVDWSRIPAVDQLRAETIIDQIDDLRERLNGEVERLERQYNKLEHRIRLRLEAETARALPQPSDND